jgi:hypothetical protein
VDVLHERAVVVLQKKLGEEGQGDLGHSLADFYRCEIAESGLG